MKDEVHVYIGRHYKPVDYEDNLKRLYTAWGVEYVPNKPITGEELTKMGLKVVFAPKTPELVTLFDNL
jgi:hypothetical protein